MARNARNYPVEIIATLPPLSFLDRRSSWLAVVVNPLGLIYPARVGLIPPKAAKQEFLWRTSTD